MGNLSSGKSALVHRYLTGTYVQEESPEGKVWFPGRGGLLLAPVPGSEDDPVPAPRLPLPPALQPPALAGVPLAPLA